MTFVAIPYLAPCRPTSARSATLESIKSRQIATVRKDVEGASHLRSLDVARLRLVVPLLRRTERLKDWPAIAARQMCHGLGPEPDLLSKTKGCV